MKPLFEHLPTALLWLALPPLAHACGSGSQAAATTRSADASQPAPLAPVPAAPEVQCEQPSIISPSVVSDAAYATRWGHDAIAFADVPTSKERPIEECGLSALLPRLASLRCGDGNNPFNGDLSQAHQSRRANVGAGGRCGRIIDVYVVACSEGTYEVFADMYFCSESGAQEF